MRIEQRNNTRHTRRAAAVAEGGTPGTGPMLASILYYIIASILYYIIIDPGTGPMLASMSKEQSWVIWHRTRHMM